ncbi:MAG: family 16 glycosylhydrolase, partial [Planctomycetia bacterium]|nr:family 16 glycosylhydrolase [Planctomycetia bacterium]
MTERTQATDPEISSAVEVPAVLTGDGWTLDSQFSDEFEGDSIDTEKWWDFNPAWPGRVPALFVRDNVAVRDGRLILTARKPRPEELTVENVARGFDQFTTAIVKSKRRSFYGYYEARSRSMNASVCNAFWLYDPLDPAAKYTEGEYSEEIDIFEIFGKSPVASADHTYYATVHRYQTPYVESVVNRKKYRLENHAFRRKVDFDFHADFHTYGMLWTPERIIWYLDGEEMFTRKNDFFHRPLHIMIDCEIMRDWVGDPDPADLPATFETEYV